MKTLTILLMKVPYQFVLPKNMIGQQWSDFKRDYNFLIQREVTVAKQNNKPSVTIDIDKLPALSGDLPALKSFMDLRLVPQHKMSIALWNQRREEAKSFFTFPCISELDASGYIKKLAK
jgi:hypothetical protein